MHSSETPRNKNEATPNPQDYFVAPEPIPNETATPLRENEARESVRDAFSEQDPRLGETKIMVSGRDIVSHRQEMHLSPTSFVSNFDQRLLPLIADRLEKDDNSSRSTTSVKEQISETLLGLAATTKGQSSGAIMEVVEDADTRVAVIGGIGFASAMIVRNGRARHITINNEPPYEPSVVALHPEDRIILSQTGLKGIRLPYTAAYNIDDVLTHPHSRDTAELLNKYNQLPDSVVVADISWEKDRQEFTPIEKKAEPTREEVLALKLTALNHKELEGEAFTDSEGTEYVIKGINPHTRGVTFKLKKDGHSRLRPMQADLSIFYEAKEGKKTVVKQRVEHTRKLGVSIADLRQHLLIQAREAKQTAWTEEIKQRLTNGENVSFTTNDGLLLEVSPLSGGVHDGDTTEYRVVSKAVKDGTVKRAAYKATLPQILSRASK